MKVEFSVVDITAKKDGKNYKLIIFNDGDCILKSSEENEEFEISNSKLFDFLDRLYKEYLLMGES